MSNKKEKGHEDGQEGKYDPPHQGAFGLRDTVLGSKYSEKEKQDRKDYKEGYRKGKKNRDK